MSYVDKTELDALLSRVREMRNNPAYPDRNAVAYDCYRMFQDLAERYIEECTFRDRYKRQSDSWRDRCFLSQWEPIKTAPKDRTWVLCAWKNSAGLYGIPTPLYWHGECWTNIDPALTPVTQNALKPTHWMPLPPSPDDLAKLNESFWIAPDGVYSDKGDGPTKIGELVVSATDEHPAIYKTQTGKLVGGK